MMNLFEYNMVESTDAYLIRYNILKSVIALLCTDYFIYSGVRNTISDKVSLQLNDVCSKVIQNAIRCN